MQIQIACLLDCSMYFGYLESLEQKTSDDPTLPREALIQYHDSTFC